MLESITPFILKGITQDVVSFLSITGLFTPTPPPYAKYSVLASNAVGALVGVLDGTAVIGELVGTDVIGESVGEIDGKDVEGLSVGETLGDAVIGLIEGEGVCGLIVGVCVGLLVV